MSALALSCGGLKVPPLEPTPTDLTRLTLFVADPSSGSAADRLALEATFRQAGYKVVGVESTHDLTAKLESNCAENHSQVPNVWNCNYLLNIIANDKLVGSGGRNYTALPHDLSDSSLAIATTLVNDLSRSEAFVVACRALKRGVVPAAASNEPATTAATSATGQSLGAPAIIGVPQRNAAPASPPFISASPQPAAFALIIGIEKYREVPAPTGARSDAENFA